MIGRTLGHYRIDAQLGAGGMGVVYKARQRGLKRLVALKMILAGEFASQAEVRRFHAEAEAAGKGVVVVGGRLVEALHVEEARRVLALAEAIAVAGHG